MSLVSLSYAVTLAISKTGPNSFTTPTPAYTCPRHRIQLVVGDMTMMIHPIPTPSPPPAFKTVFKVASRNIDIYQRAYNHSLRSMQSLCWSRTSVRCLLCLVGALPVLPYSHFRHSVVMPMCSASLIGILCCVTYLSLLCTLYSIPHQAHTQLAAPARLWYFT